MLYQYLSLPNFEIERISLEKTFDHIIHGKITIDVLDPKSNKVIESGVYSMPQLIDKEFDSRFSKVNIKVSISGFHTYDNLNTGKIRFKNQKKLVGVLPTGEEIFKGKIECYIPLLDEANSGSNHGWKTKKNESTFWPSTWSHEKISSKIIEAFNSKSLEFNDRKWTALTSEGIEITGYIDKNTGIIETAFIKSVRQN